ncbi:unnamed protein product [Effrenium voratum]|nr:unnamed protein product [Effrenium voratum]
MFTVRSRARTCRQEAAKSIRTLVPPDNKNLFRFQIMMGTPFGQGFVFRDLLHLPSCINVVGRMFRIFQVPFQQGKSNISESALIFRECEASLCGCADRGML